MILPLIFAFQIGSPISGACHEAITLAASSQTGFPDPAAAPHPTENQARALEDLTFDLPADHRDVWSMTLVIGVRSNDIGDHAPSDLSDLVAIHNDPDDQPAHCLRGPSDDGPDGDVAAIASCRAFILDELSRGGLLADTIDTEATEPVAVFLAFRGRVVLDLPRYAYHLGRAVHALEDSYAHMMRDPVTGHVRSVLNWIDFVTSDHYDSVVDGYEHLSKIDDCRRSEPYEVLRVQHATEAVTALLEALKTPDAATRSLAVNAALDGHLILDPGCTVANHWCNATEPAEENDGCNVGHGAGLALAFALLGLTRRTRRREANRGSIPVALRVFVLFASIRVLEHRAHAEPYLDGRFGAALDRTALAGSIGAGQRYDRWSGGIELEWNPWLSLDAGRAAPGALNAYATVAHVWYAGPCFELYSRAELGTSTILMELVGVDKFHTGLYAGGSLLGISFKHDDHWRFTFDPSHFAMPTPQLTGVPFYYRQYRITVGAEYRF